MGSASYVGEARKMGSFRVYVREPVENKRLRRKILDSGLWSSKRAASAR
jgi:hypothetical protein